MKRRIIYLKLILIDIVRHINQKNWRNVKIDIRFFINGIFAKNINRGLRWRKHI